MKTFREFVSERGWFLEDNATTANVSADIANLGNDLAKRNPKIIPGLTSPDVIKQAMTDPKVKQLIAKDPKAAGAVGAYLGGPDAIKQMGVQNNKNI